MKDQRKGSRRGEEARAAERRRDGRGVQKRGGERRSVC